MHSVQVSLNQRVQVYLVNTIQNQVGEMTLLTRVLHLENSQDPGGMAFYQISIIRVTLK